MKRLKKIEILRVIAMSAVVMNHVNAVAITEFGHAEGLELVYYSYLLQCVARFAVPVFFMISGYLMLSNSYLFSWDKLLKSIWKYIMIIGVFGTGFAWIELVFNERTIGLAQLPKAAYAMLIGRSWDHLWFLYAYLGMLLAFPIFKLFWHGADDKTKRYVTLGGIILTSLAPLLKLGIQFPISSAFPFCFLVGGCLRDLESKNYHIRKRCLWAVITGCCLSFTVITYFRLFYNSELCEQLSAATSVPMLLLAAAISALCILNNDQSLASSKLLFFSTNSFGVYIYHMFWLNILYKVIKLNPYQYGFAGMLVCFLGGLVITIVISVLTTVVTRKLPVLKKLL